MEIDEHSDSTAKPTENVQISHECDSNINSVPEVCDQLQIKCTPSCRTKSCSKRIRMRKNLTDNRKIQLMKYDHPMPVLSCNEQVKIGFKTHVQRFYHRSTTFQKREITTIQEEVFQFKKQSRNPFVGITSENQDKVRLLQVKIPTHSSLRGIKSKSKDYKEKVASLKLLIQKLRLSNLAKPIALQNSLADETIQLFERIHL